MTRSWERERDSDGTGNPERLEAMAAARMIHLAAGSA